MFAALVLATFPLLPAQPVPDDAFSPSPDESMVELGVEPADHLAIPPLGPLERQEPQDRHDPKSKKDAWLAEKAARLDVHVADRDISRAARWTSGGKGRAPATILASGATVPAGVRQAPLVTLYNLRTHETLPILQGQTPAMDERFSTFLRDHYTNQATRMDDRLVGVLASVARRFSAGRIDVVSGYRSPKYNLMLRKKGREVARSSQHMEGHAVDFRIQGVPTKRLLNYVRSLRMGGVGYYPHSQFVHSDTGRIRFWRGT